MCYSPRFQGGPGVRGCRGPKIDLGMAGKMGNVLVFLVFVSKDIWLVEQLKQHERGN